MKIAIASGKGGTGKTTLSVNLASFLVTERKKNVILADFDVEEPNSNLFLDLKEISSEEKFVMVPSWQEESCIHCGKCAKVCKLDVLKEENLDNINFIASTMFQFLIGKVKTYKCYLYQVLL